VRCRRSRLWFVEKGKVELRMCEKLEALQLRTVALMRTFRNVEVSRVGFISDILPRSGPALSQTSVRHYFKACLRRGVDESSTEEKLILDNQNGRFGLQNSFPSHLSAFHLKKTHPL
jgi:hypothetical protein